MSDAKPQKALFLESEKGRFGVGLRNIPKPGEDELLIQVYSAALNHADYKVEEQEVIVEKYPVVLGQDIAGIVHEAGEGIKNFAKGDRVFSHSWFSDDRAAFQQFALGVADFTAKIPNNLGYDEAATIPLTFDTASIGLYCSSEFGLGLTPPWVEGGIRAYRGTPIVILGGSSAVGSYAIQLARLSGFSRIIATASLTHEKYLKSLGATHVLNRDLSANDLKTAVSNVSRKPIKYVFDTISLLETQQVGWSLLAQDGRLLLTLPPLVEEEEKKGRKFVRSLGSPHACDNRPFSTESWAIFSEWLKAGTIKPIRYEVLPDGLEGIINGLERIKKGKVSGTKLVAHPQDTK
ncbi:GroES-like protein [Suillus decipiens]|nr:GroES-like protein [Suillus decipiens]